MYELIKLLSRVLRHETKQRNNPFINKLRRIDSVLTEMDENIIQKPGSFFAQDLTNFLQCFSD